MNDANKTHNTIAERIANKSIDYIMRLFRKKFLRNSILNRKLTGLSSLSLSISWYFEVLFFVNSHSISTFPLTNMVMKQHQKWIACKQNLFIDLIVWWLTWQWNWKKKKKITAIFALFIIYIRILPSIWFVDCDT